MPPVPTHHSPHPGYTRSHATDVSTLLRKERYPRHARYTRKHAPTPPTLAQISRHFSNLHSENFEQLSAKQLS